MASRSASSGVSILESRYFDLCRRHEVFPNPSLVSALSKAKVQELRRELCVLEVVLDRFTSSDLRPFIEALAATNLSGIDVVDVRQDAACVWLDGEYVLSLLQTVNEKLRVVDVRDWLFWKDVLRHISRRGLACHILNLRYAPIANLNLSGNFLQLHTLNLDFCISLSSFRISCFSCMPSLMRLSMCETRISNLWMASAALSKLPSLVELRFQNCLCCSDTRACAKIFGNDANSSPGCQNISSFQPLSMISNGSIHTNMQYSLSTQTPSYLLNDDESFTNQESHESTNSDSLGSELDFSNIQHDLDKGMGRSVNATFDFVGDSNMEVPLNQFVGSIMQSSDSPVPMHFQSFQEAPYSEVIKMNRIDGNRHISNIGNVIYNSQPVCPNSDEYHDLNIVHQASSRMLLEGSHQPSIDLLSPNTMAESSHVASRKYFSQHPSPICFEKHYREYMIASLPQLKVLDNLRIRGAEREKASVVFKQHFELLPYRRPFRQSVTTVLTCRELGISKVFRRIPLKQSYTSRDNNHFFIRSLLSAKTNSSPWPHMHSLSKSKSLSRGEMKNFRPRQFEYHPSNPGLMAFGTLDGEVVVLNHESDKPVGYIPSSGAFNSILGLCWLKNHPSKLIAGSDNGSLKLYDVSRMSPVLSDRYCNQDATTCSFDEFEHLTSVHVNSTDELFLASGFSKHVALYDIGTGKRLQVFKDLHLEHINVVKFAHHSPSLFATASFDQDVKMWDLRQGISCPCHTVSSPRGNVMVCFSPDDHYLLSSAVDNEVRQHLAVDGRLHMAFDISPTGSSQNYTRSYYMNGRDYIISGSSEENVVRVCCSQTGRRLRDIPMERGGLRNSVFVQSLRGDPFQAFQMSVLAAYLRPSSKSKIIQVNMLASGEGEADDNLCIQSCNPSLDMGG